LPDLASAATSAASAAADAAASSLSDDANLLTDFDVRFLGLKVDHRVIVEWVVAGQTIGFIGSVMGGLNARARKEEVESLNKRLLAVNKQLREAARTAPPRQSHAPGSAAEPESGRASELIALLRAGKALLKQSDGRAARDKFQAALQLARGDGGVTGDLSEPWKAQRKALRGLGAACQLLGDADGALAYMQEVLALSEKAGDSTAIADALGVIADLYADKGDLDKAGQMYDRYLARLSEA